MRDYMEHPEIQHFVLERSWVLGISATPGRVDFEMDLVFAEDHPDIRPPRDGEAVYSRIGLLRFHGVVDLEWRGQGIQPVRDATGEQDWGAIDSMQFEDGRYRLEGDWGTVAITASGIEVRLTGATK
jgi:hypothetical protein